VTQTIYAHKNKRILKKSIVNRHEDQCNRTEISPHNYSYMIFNKDAKNRYWKKTASSINAAGKTGCPHETRSLSLALYKNQFKMDQRP
jgi:hypothetical protein